MIIQCTSCEDILWSKYQHDFVACSCFGKQLTTCCDGHFTTDFTCSKCGLDARLKGVAIDGGDFYHRVLGTTMRVKEWRPVMGATKYDMEIEQGATFLRKFEYLKNGEPVDLYGVDIRMQMRRRAEAAGVLGDFTIGNGFTVVQPEAGKFELEISATQTADMDFPWALYDLELEFPDGKVIKLLHGSISVRREITR